VLAPLATGPYDVCCPLTSPLMDAPLVRLAVEPSPRNGLRKPSQLLVETFFTAGIAAVGAVVGQLQP
jgi:mRNA interferase MazF